MVVILSMAAISAGCSNQSAAGDPKAAASGKSATATPDEALAVKKGAKAKIDTSSRREHDRARKGPAEKAP